MPTIPRLRIDHLYIVAALALAGFVVALMPIVPHDFWWHMAIGRDIAQSGQIPTVDHYSWALPDGTPFTYQSWLSEWIFYQVYGLGGMSAIVWLRNGLLLATWTVLAFGAYRRSGSWRLAALAIAGLTILTINNMTMRPQSFSWLPFAVYATLLAAYCRGAVRDRTLLILPALMVFWVNLHGAFVLGLILVVITAIGETAKLFVFGTEAAAPARVRRLWLIAILTIFATIANPDGLGVFGYVGNLLGNQPVQGLVMEWQPLAMDSTSGLIFSASVLVSAGLMLRGRQRPDLTDILIWGACLWLALGGVRSVIWWAMVAWPMVAGALGQSAPARRRARANYANTVLAVSLLFLPLAVQPPFKPLWTLPPVFGGLGTSVPDGSLLTADTPVKAVAWMQQHPLPQNARLFHDMGYGSYLIWALPQTKVYVDPRIELYPLDEWMRYKRITAACDYNRDLTQLGATHLLLDHKGQADLVTALEHDATWHTLYSDDSSVLLARTNVSSTTTTMADHESCVAFR